MLALLAQVRPPFAPGPGPELPFPIPIPMPNLGPLRLPEEILHTARKVGVAADAIAHVCERGVLDLFLYGGICGSVLTAVLLLLAFTLYRSFRR